MIQIKFINSNSCLWRYDNNYYLIVKSVRVDFLRKSICGLKINWCSFKLACNKLVQRHSKHLQIYCKMSSSFYYLEEKDERVHFNLVIKVKEERKRISCLCRWILFYKIHVNILFYTLYFWIMARFIQFNRTETFSLI